MSIFPFIIWYLSDIEMNQYFLIIGGIMSLWVLIDDLEIKENS
jgi:hypothetical protein